MNIGPSAPNPVVIESEPLVIDTEQVEYGGVKVVPRHGVLASRRCSENGQWTPLPTGYPLRSTFAMHLFLLPQADALGASRWWKPSPTSDFAPDHRGPTLRHCHRQKVPPGVRRGRAALSVPLTRDTPSVAMREAEQSPSRN